MPPSGWYLDANGEIGDGQDIEWIGVAMDEKNIYCAIRVVNNVKRRDRQYFAEFKGQNVLSLRYWARESNVGVNLVKGQDRENAKSYSPSESPVRVSYGEIFEYSYPWKKILQWNGAHARVHQLNFIIQRHSDPWHIIDSYSINCMLPELYYDLAVKE